MFTVVEAALQEGRLLTVVDVALNIALKAIWLLVGIEIAYVLHYCLRLYSLLYGV